MDKKFTSISDILRSLGFSCSVLKVSLHDIFILGVCICVCIYVLCIYELFTFFDMGTSHLKSCLMLAQQTHYRLTHTLQPQGYPFIISFLFLGYDIIESFLSSLSSLQTLSYTPPQLSFKFMPSFFINHCYIHIIYFQHQTGVNIKGSYFNIKCF